MKIKTKNYKSKMEIKTKNYKFKMLMKISYKL